MDKGIKFQLVLEAEYYLSLIHIELSSLEQKLRNLSPDSPSRPKLITELEQKRIRFAKLTTDVIIFKLQNNIFTDQRRLNNG